MNQILICIPFGPKRCVSNKLLSTINPDPNTVNSTLTNHRRNESPFDMSLAIETLYQIDPAQVGDLGVCDNPNSAANHLTNSIHPLWAYRNWSRNVRAKNTPRIERGEARQKPLTKGVQRARCNELPTDTFERILPALRLASLFLEKSLPWFWNLRYAPYQGFGTLNQTELQLDEVGWDQDKENQIRQDLDVVAQRYFLLHGLHGCEMNATAMSSFVCLNLDGDVPEDPDEDTYVIYWKKKAHLLTVFAKEAIGFVGSCRWPRLPLAMQHRCLFQIASLLMHELAHVVMFYRAEDKLLHNEPYFRRTEPSRELGFSWEYYMFDGIITMVDGEFTGNRPEFGIEGVTCLFEWPHDFHSHVQMYTEWKHPKSRMDDLKHPPGRWLIASKSIEQFFDMRRWNQWLGVPVKHGPMDLGPFVVHLSPSLFMSLYQERSLSYDIWYLRRLHRATGLVWPEVTDHDSHYSDSDHSPPESPCTLEVDTSSGNAMDTS
jgi:hypothetical protein